uniref:Uncharacterized protein n=1 Tax=Onchocerca volvulus TaxID=6282 RepID=A0A8R1XXM3_ONCVO
MEFFEKSIAALPYDIEQHLINALSTSVICVHWEFSKTFIMNDTMLICGHQLCDDFCNLFELLMHRNRLINMDIAW